MLGLKSGSLPTLFCEISEGSILSKLTDRIAELAAPAVEAAGCRLWDVEYVREAGTWYLRVFVDKDGGVSIDDCEAISRALDPILDREDPIPDSYVFEVGSAGADRELKRERDFNEFMGHDVEVRLYQPQDGSKRFVGTLAGFDNGAVSILLPDKSTRRFEKNQIAQVRLAVSIGG